MNVAFVQAFVVHAALASMVNHAKVGDEQASAEAIAALMRMKA
jgi:hypothetical protein